MTVKIEFDKETKQAILKTLTIEKCNKKIDETIVSLYEAIDDNWKPSAILEIACMLKYYRACYELIKEDNELIKSQIKRAMNY